MLQPRYNFAKRRTSTVQYRYLDNDAMNSWVLVEPVNLVQQSLTSAHIPTLRTLAYMSTVYCTKKL